MRPFRGFVWGCALAALLGGGGKATAAWNNVFQVCCHSCRSAPAAPVVAAYADPCPQPATSCTTRYVQRSYYQPVTSYRTSTYYEPVTTYRTSYYYEPVTTYRYSCYFDPCTCRYQQMAQPVTSYRLRSQCCPVTSYLQRTCMQPVTTYQQSFYYEPVTTCCTTTTGAPVAAPPPGAPPAPPSPAPPSVTPDDRSPSLPRIEERDGGATTSESYKPSTPPPGFMPKASDSSFRAPAPAAPPPRVRFERIAARAGGQLEGQVVRADRAPQAGAKVLFVSTDKRAAQQTVTADGRGQFRVDLASGGWLVYIHDGAGRPVFLRRVDVQDGRTHPMTLVSR